MPPQFRSNRSVAPKLMLIIIANVQIYPHLPTRRCIESPFCPRAKVINISIFFSTCTLKRPLIREDLNVIQNISPRRLMPHLLHQMVQNRTNLGGHSIQMITRINQATTIHQSATNTGSNSVSEYCDSGGISTGPVPQARLGAER